MLRRRPGDLETAVLGVLWAAGEPMVPGAVQAALDTAHHDPLAYNTVMTILVRLHDKGLVARERVGRAYAYRPVVDEEEVVTDQVRRLLQGSADRGAVVHAFVNELDPADAALLRRLLAETGEPA